MARRFSVDVWFGAVLATGVAVVAVLYLALGFSQVEDSDHDFLDNGWARAGLGLAAIALALSVPVAIDLIRRRARRRSRIAARKRRAAAIDTALKDPQTSRGGNHRHAAGTEVNTQWPSLGGGRHALSVGPPDEPASGSVEG